jgi:hypothetical protein
MLGLNRPDLAFADAVRRGGLAQLLAVLFCVIAAAEPTAKAAPGPTLTAPNPRPTMQYEIGPQSLIDALEAFSNASGVQVLYDASLATGRNSPGVTGQQSPEAALEAILSGSGLRATFVRSNAVYIYPARATATTSPDGAAAGGPSPGAVMALGTLHVDAPGLTIGHPRFDSYAAALQIGVREALEKEPAARRGAWLVTAELDLGVDGRVRKARLIGSTGDGKVDAIIAKVLAATRLPPPPPDLPQPVKVQIHAAGT